MRSSITMDYAKQQFKAWRKTKRAGERIPDALWVITYQLLTNPDYRKSTIRKELGISSQQLKSKFPELVKQSKANVTPASKQIFLQAPPLTNLLPSKPAESSLLLRHSTGVELKICSPTNEQFASIVKLFMEQNQCYK